MKKNFNLKDSFIYPIIAFAIIFVIAVYILKIPFEFFPNQKQPEEPLFETKNNCSSEYIPVCGEDGLTYRNACFANMANITYKTGKCPIEPNQIFDENKNKEIKVCTREYDPVCGEDGQTHSNSCVAESQNIKILYKGECKIDDNKNSTNSGKIEENQNENIILEKNSSGSIDFYRDGKYHIYENKGLNYGFAMPNYSYYQGLIPMEGSAHTMIVGIDEKGIENFETAQIKVLLYKKEPNKIPENAVSMTFSNDYKLYIIPKNSENPKLQKIITTITESVYKN